MPIVHYRQKRLRGIRLDTPDLSYLRKRLKPFGKDIAAKHFVAAIRKALRPGLNALKARTPEGPTGNLRRSIRIKTKQYKKQGTGWGIVGYTYKGTKQTRKNSGGTVGMAKDRGFHAHLLEYGTKQRKIYRTPENPLMIASSYRRLGRFKLFSENSRVKTFPPYPRAFFKRGSKTAPYVSTGQVFGQGMLQRAYAASKSKMEEKLRSVINKTIENAWKDLNKRKGG